MIDIKKMPSHCKTIYLFIYTLGFLVLIKANAKHLLLFQNNPLGVFINKLRVNIGGRMICTNNVKSQNKTSMM